MYTNIIFVQDCTETYNEVNEIFRNNGGDAAIKYLSQWDYGYESEYDLCDHIEKHPLEDVYTGHADGDDYILIVHPLYYSLYREAYSKE